MANSGALFAATTSDIGKATLNVDLMQPRIDLPENGRKTIPAADILAVDFPYSNTSGTVMLPNDKSCLGPNLLRNLKNKLPNFSYKDFEENGFEMEVNNVAFMKVFFPF